MTVRSPECCSVKLESLSDWEQKTHIMNTHQSKRILVADQEDDIRTLICHTLSREGYSPVETSDSASTLEMARAQKWELVVLDLMQPGLDGLGTCRALKTFPETRDIPIILLTANPDEADRLAGLAMGADAYLTKPFSPRALITRINYLLLGGSGRFAQKEMPCAA